MAKVNSKMTSVCNSPIQKSYSHIFPNIQVPLFQDTSENLKYRKKDMQAFVCELKS